MRVLQLTDDLAMIGGVQRYLSALETMMPSHGVECSSWAPPPGPLEGAASRWYGRRYLRLVRELIRRLRPDLVHAHNVWMRLSPLPLRAAVEAGVPVLMTVHDYHWICPRKWMVTASDVPCEAGFGVRCAVAGCRGSHEGRRWIAYNALRWVKTGWQRRLVRGAVGRFISPSRHLARWLQRSLDVADVLHLPNFAEAPRGGSAPPVVQPSRLLFAGRLSREKGVDVLLRSLPLVAARHPEVRLTIAGDGPARESLVRLAGTIGVDHLVRFAGALPPDEVGRCYAGSGLVVLPTLWMENCPVSVLEAFAHGRAVVATDIGGLPELIDDGRTGVLVRRGDELDLGGRLADLLSEPERVVAMGHRARASWARSFTPEQHGRRLRAAYDEALADGG